MLFPVLIFALATEFATSQTVDDCPATLTRDEYLQVHGDSCFRFVLYQKRNHDDAQSDCRADNGTLALVQSEEIQNYLLDQILNVYNHSGTSDKLWIGLDDIDEEGTFVWEDGTKEVYSNWRAYQTTVTMVANNEDCVVIDLVFHGQWVRVECNIVHAYEFGFTFPQSSLYVCQYKLDVTVQD